MKVIIGTAFLRKSTNEILETGKEYSDFTDDELKEYEGLYRLVEIEKKAEEKKTESKNKSKSKQ